MPLRRLVRIDRQTGGLRDDGRVTFSIGAGPLRLVWEARHFGYVRGKQFCDEQVRGPFKVWRHTHRIEAIDANRSLYEDRVEFALPGGRWVQRMLTPLVSRLLASAFARRHAIVRSRFTAA
jgi:ligand-binding SRPBCC domain-containing protein